MITHPALSEVANSTTAPLNKHAKNLRALPVILPANTDRAIPDVLAKAAEEIDLQQAALARHREFVELLTQCAGGMVHGTRLSRKAKELL